MLLREGACSYHPEHEPEGKDAQHTQAYVTHKAHGRMPLASYAPGTMHGNTDPAELPQPLADGLGVLGAARGQEPISAVGIKKERTTPLGVN